MVDPVRLPAAFGLASRLKNARATVPGDLASGALYGGVVMPLAGLSLAVLIFSPQGLEPTMGFGIRAVLMATWIMNLIVCLRSSYFFATAGPDSNYAALLAVTAAEVVALLGQRGAGAGQMGATVLALLAASAFVVGAAALAIGQLRGGRFARHIPYPVAGGFLAGSGFLVLAGGFRVLTGSPLTWQGASAVLQTPLLSLGVASAVALAVLVTPQFTRHALATPGIMAGGLLLFYGGFFFLGMSVDEARVEGMLLRPLAAARSPLPPIELLDQVHWDVVLGQTSSLLAVAVIVVLGVSLSAANLEMATQRDADFDRELRANGIANLAAGLAGGLAGGMNAGRSLLMLRSGAATRAAGVWSSVLCLFVFVAFEPILYFFPKPVLAGILLGVGGGYLRDWLWDAYRKVPRAEYALIWAILVLIVAVGLVPGVAAGLIVAGLLFAYRYGHTQVIRRSLSSSVHFSNKERSPEEIARLRQVGNHAWTLTLQGYIFFGTSSVVVDSCRQLIEREGARYVILDFRLVQGIDVSAAATLTRLAQVYRRSGAKLVLTNVHADVLDLLRKAGLVPHPAVEILPGLDEAMEWVEDQLLGRAETNLRESLAPHFSSDSLDLLLPYFESIGLDEGAALFHEGDPGNELYFIERGEVAAQVHLEGGRTLRVRKMGAGTIVGEMGLYTRQPRAADVVAEVPTTVLRLTAERLARLEAEHPEVAIRFHSFLVKTLSARLAASTEQVRALI